MSRAVARRFTPSLSKSWAAQRLALMLTPATCVLRWDAWVRRDLWSRAARRLGRFCCRAVLPTRASVAKRLRTAPRRASRALLLVCCRFCGFNGQLLKTGFALPTTVIKQPKQHFPGAAEAVKAWSAVVSRCVAALSAVCAPCGSRACAHCRNAKTQIATGSKKLPRQRAVEFLPLDALSQPRSAPQYQKPRAGRPNLIHHQTDGGLLANRGLGRRRRGNTARTPCCRTTHQQAPTTPLW